MLYLIDIRVQYSSKSSCHEVHVNLRSIFVQTLRAEETGQVFAQLAAFIYYVSREGVVT